MIHAAVVVMTVMGCGDQVKSCDVIPKPQKVWQSLQKCDAAIPAVLRRSANSPYPVITAQCDVKGGSSLSAQSKTLVVRPSKGLPGHVGQTIEPPVFAKAEKQAAGGIAWSMSDAVLHRTRNGYLLVRGGTDALVSMFRHSAQGSFAGVRDGVRASLYKSVVVARRTLGGLRDNVERAD